MPFNDPNKNYKDIIADAIAKAKSAAVNQEEVASSPVETPPPNPNDFFNLELLAKIFSQPMTLSNTNNKDYESYASEIQSINSTKIEMLMGILIHFIIKDFLEKGIFNDNRGYFEEDGTFHLYNYVARELIGLTKEWNNLTRYEQEASLWYGRKVWIALINQLIER